MKKLSLLLVLVLFLLAGVNCVIAAPEWIAIEGTASEQYFVDTSRIIFSVQDPEIVVDYWVKIVQKDKPDGYSLSRVLARKSDMNFIEKERTLYSAAGTRVSSKNFIKDGWKKIKPDGYVGKTAKYVLSEYQAKQDTREYVSPNPIEPQQFSGAVDSKKIKFDLAQDGTKRYLVRDTTTQSALHTSMDFWVLIDANNNKTYRFNLATISSLANKDIVKVVAICVDDEEWVLATPLPKGATTFPPYTDFKLSYEVPPSLYQAILNSKKGITIKWYYGHGPLLFGFGDIGEWQYTLPEPVVQNIKILYAGTK